MAAEAGGRYGEHPYGQPVTQAVVDRLGCDALRLDGPDAQHLLKSLRLRIGEDFVATDGRGTLARLTVTRADRHGLDAVVAARTTREPPALRLWLATGAEGARADWLVEKAVELGVWALLPLAGDESRRGERWERVARAALKQSLGAWALRIEAGGALDRARSGEYAAIWLADPEGDPPLGASIPAAGDVLLVAGPPGGLTSEERRQWLGAGARPIRLGAHRLRAETAALALVVAAQTAAAGNPQPLPGKEG